MENLIPPISSVYVLLGIVIVIALLGLLSSIVVEALTGILNLRKRTLVQALRELFQGNQDFLETFLRHPLIQQYSSSDSKRGVALNDLPDYISSSTFSSILLDIYEHRESAPNSRITIYLSRLFDACGRDTAVFSRRIEQWYQEKMEHTANVYSKKIRSGWLLVTSLIIVIIFNAEITGLYLRITQSVDSSSSEHLTVVTENLERLLAIDSTLAASQTVASIKEGLLYQMDVTVHPRKEPILGYNGIASIPNSSNAWLIWLLGALVSALAASFAAVMWTEIFKRSFAIVRSTQVSNPPAPIEPSNRPPEIKPYPKQEIG